MNIRRIALGLIVSAVCLYFVLRGVEWSAVLNHLSQVNLPLFLFSMLLMLAAYFLMAWRWQLLLAPLELPPAPDANDSLESTSVVQDVSVQQEGLFSLYSKMLTGYFFNAFFPARAGDLVRAYLLGRKTGLRKTTVLATIVIEKAFDGIALLVLFLISLILLPAAISNASGVSPDVLAWVAGVALIAAIAGLVLFYRFSDRIVQLVGRIFDVLPLPRRLERLAVRLIETFAGGMHIFKTPRPLLFAGIISLVIWGVVAAMFLAALVSFKASFPAEMMTIAGLLFMTGLVNLGLLVPALPGNVGTYEALCVAAMAVFGVTKELAVAFALVFHVGQLVTTLAVGAVAFWSQNLSFAEMRPVEEKAEQEAAQSLDMLDPEVRP
ncbi:MAG TPA: lysylphosphatidylglycerol synthase transmembrane domain-containing protein [Chloroflexia bacterium]|nr:lysylphosphatidylglycerol synthase transmembrane domain-containing protein [Chloroflexia bacterium]